MNRTISTVGLVAVFAIGCASTLPSSRVQATETAVQSARESGAGGVPEADKHLKMADDALAQAKSLNRKGEGDEAEAMLTRAEADAALAAALSDEAKQKAAIQGSKGEVRAKQPPPDSNR
jgi:hypothetical protein